jgi:hypothetical protein
VESSYRESTGDQREPILVERALGSINCGGIAASVYEEKEK